MTPRRAIATVVAVVLALTGLALASRREPVVLQASFASLGRPTMPFVPTGSFITSSWFCPGVPAGEADVGGSVTITNPNDEAMTGTVTAYTTSSDESTAGPPSASRPITVEPRSATTVDLVEMQPSGSFVAAVVEINGGGGFVEQVARHPAGDAVAACANAASSDWYFADGFTVDGSTEQLVLTNPYPDAAIVDIGFVTADGVRRPSRLQGYPVPGHSVQVVELGARDEPVVAAEVVASRGRVVAGRSQHYVGGGRLGYTMTLGAPSLSTQYWFADGERGTGITESYSIFNPTDEDVTVYPVFLGAPVSAEFTNDREITVPKGRVVTFDTADEAQLPDGRHGVVFSTFSTASIVVERVITRPAGDSVATSVVMGSPPELASRRWSAAISSDIAVDEAIVVLNADNIATTVTVSTLGTGGLVPVPGLEALPLAAGAVLTIPINDPSAIGVPFVVTSDQSIFVERLLPRGADLRGRSGSFALAG
ncbi:MAG: DUF5719 family protein [Ilumatobacteraceae bacterium]